MPPPIDVVVRPQTLDIADVEGSTGLWSALQDVMIPALKAHNDCLRRIAAELELYEVKSEGDGMFFSAASSLQATRFCLRAQKELLSCDWPPELLQTEQGRPIE